MLTAAQAYRVAVRWKFHTRSGKFYGHFYGFHPNDGRPVSEEHRRQCLTYLDIACIPAANFDIDRGIDCNHQLGIRQIGGFPWNLCIGTRNLRQLYQLRRFLMVASLYAGH